MIWDLARHVSSRRGALGGLLAGVLLPLGAAARGKQKQRKRTGKDKQRAKAQAETCWRAGACIPKKGANLSRCDLAGYSPATTLDCTGCNISRANLQGANLSGANLTKANLSGSCLVGATLSGATIANSTNLANAIFCNTTMPDGSINNSGCDATTACCPRCTSSSECALGLVCRDGLCQGCLSDYDCVQFGGANFCRVAEGQTISRCANFDLCNCPGTCAQCSAEFGCYGQGGGPCTGNRLCCPYSPGV